MALAEGAARVRTAVGEIVVLIWTVLTLAFSLLIVVGFLL